jgi:uncharacterized protein (TIGR03032 family)
MSTNSALRLLPSPGFAVWMTTQKLSLGFTTYQAGKLFLLGVNAQGGLSAFERSFEQAMGLCVKNNSLYLATLYQLWRLENVLPKGGDYQGYDAVYTPQMSCVTGHLDVHDIAVDSQDGLLFVNTLFSCVAEASPTHSFKPVWQPDFISALQPEDRCHLNGMAMQSDKPAYVTAVARSDTPEGWRERRADGGIVIDVQQNRIIAEGLSMPHSPRWHDGALWLLNSGRGELLRLNAATGTHEMICFCPGYARGLAINGDYAIIGLSKPRVNSAFDALPLCEILERHHEKAMCGLLIVNLKSGLIEHRLKLEGLISEIYDVAALPGVTRPMALGLKTPEIQKMISIETV